MPLHNKRSCSQKQLGKEKEAHTTLHSSGVTYPAYADSRYTGTWHSFTRSRWRLLFNFPFSRVRFPLHPQRINEEGVEEVVPGENCFARLNSFYFEKPSPRAAGRQILAPPPLPPASFPQETNKAEEARGARSAPRKHLLAQEVPMAKLASILTNEPPRGKPKQNRAKK